MATPGWNPADFQTDVFDFWKWGVTMLSLGVTMFNFMVVCAALRNRRIRADLFLYAANALLLSQCILHTIYPLTVSVSRILVIKTGGWSEPLCSSNAVMGNFSITAAALLGLSMSIERLLAVVFLKRMKPKFALACILATIVLSLLNVQAHFFFAESHTLIGRSGLGCYPSSVCTFQGLADASIYLVNAIFMAFTYAAILRQLSRNFSQRRKDTALIQTAVPSPVPLGKSKSGISMQSVSFKFARMVPRKMSREDRIQIIFAIRGVVGVAVFTYVPFFAN
ncbi:hypothetical protein BC828DRAFT_413699 [Blastocladiella britannica]|nr:hypothetical protein BC828DRAFT_413699 [Blastocladiella britannica]